MMARRRFSSMVGIKGKIIDNQAKGRMEIEKIKQKLAGGEGEGSGTFSYDFSIPFSKMVKEDSVSCLVEREQKSLNLKFAFLKEWR